jgi:hypothetical protein
LPAGELLPFRGLGIPLGTVHCSDGKLTPTASMASAFLLSSTGLAQLAVAAMVPTDPLLGRLHSLGSRPHLAGECLPDSSSLSITCGVSIF